VPSTNIGVLVLPGKQRRSFAMPTVKSYYELHAITTKPMCVLVMGKRFVVESKTSHFLIERWVRRRKIL